MIRIGLVDDHQLFRKSLSLLLGSYEGLLPVFDSDDGNEMISFLKTDAIDIALIDIQMPLMDGYELSSQLRRDYPQVKILIVSQLTTKEAVHKVMEIGANGFFTKNSPPEQLERAIKSVMDKDYYFDIALSAVLREAILWEKVKKNNHHEIEIGSFTGREIEIIKLSCQEYSSKGIASKLFISVRTVEKHRNRIMEKANAKNFIGAIVYALKKHFIAIDDI